jgi:predicted TIM-barrel fold metal-dependent hydrolase
LLAAAEPETEILDCATHFYDTGRPQGVPWPSSKEPILYQPTFPERYLAAVRPYRVDGVVAIEASPWLEDNLWLLTLGDRSPLIRAVVGNISPGHPDFRAALDRFAKHPLWRGVRINASAIPKLLADPAAMADLRRLMESGLSLDVLVGPPLFDPIAKLSIALPDLRIMVGHLPLDDATGIEALRTRNRVYAKVSGVVRKSGQVPTARLAELWDVFGPDRTVYASNWPTSDLVAPYPTVYKTMADYLAGQSAELRSRFFSRNARAFYRLG